MSTYKSAKEAFVSDTAGSSVAHVNAISLVALSSIFLHSAVDTRLRRGTAHSASQSQSNADVLAFVVDFVLLVVPMLLGMTLFAARPLALSAALVVPGILLVVLRPSFLSQAALLPVPSSHSGPSSSSSSRPPSPTSRSPSMNSLIPPYTNAESKRRLDDPSSPRDVPNQSASSERERSVPYLTVYRSHMLLMTILAILAVDFPVFPRYLAKCESFGVSLMDLGVGSFVFSQGLVAASPLVKDPTYLNAPLVPKMIHSIRRALPVLALGLGRVLLVKGTDYPEHVSEYGVHWNFFITMGVMAPLSILLHPLIRHASIALIGLGLALLQEILLRATPLGLWGLATERHGLIGQNKEGIISLLGYLAIHTFGLLMGTLLLPPSPSTFRRMLKAQRGSNADLTTNSPNNNNGKEKKQSAPEPDKAAIELFSYAMAWWSLLGIAAISLPLVRVVDDTSFGVVDTRHGSTISRRLANLPYILWISAYNTSFLLSYLILHTSFYALPSPSSIKFPYKPPASSTPARGARGKIPEPEVRRSDRGPGVSPTEAAVAAASAYSTGAFVEAANGGGGGIGDGEGYGLQARSRGGSPSPAPSPSRLKRSNSRRATHKDVDPDAGAGVGDAAGGEPLGLGIPAVSVTYHDEPLDASTSSPRGQSRSQSQLASQQGAPELLEAINKNGLVIFLLANVLTGLVNLSMETMFATDSVALAVLVGYSAMICAVAWGARGRRLW